MSLLFFRRNIFSFGLLLLYLQQKNKRKTSIAMNDLLKNLGVIVLLIGVVVLAIPAFLGKTTNAILLTGTILVVGGYIAHIFLNKKIQN